MMEDQFVKHFTRTASSEEEIELCGWLDADEEHLQEYLYWRQLWNLHLLNTRAGEPPIGFDAMLEAKMRERNMSMSNFQDLTGRKAGLNSKRILLQRIGRIAAVFLIAFGLGWTINSLQQTIEPESAYHSLEVPTGQRVKLTLPDGTLVWLNAQTKFTYPAVFCKRSRTVRLEGEGLFEVAADKSRPFTVQTGKYDVTATGTKFDVYAYNNSEAFETVMIEGSVEVSVRDTVAATKAKTKNKAFALKAGDKLWYDENMKSFKRAKVVPADYTSWIDGIYYFNDITFGEMSKRLEHYYKTEIIINDSILLNYRCTGRFLQNESITDIMDVVKADKAFRYTYDNENNTLTIKPKR